MAVDLVTIHHEAGASAGGSAPNATPTDDVWRYSHGGYTYGIGNSLWARFRSVAESYATLNFNHVSLDCCWSSDRHTQCQVTDAQIALLHDAFMDAYNRGEVTATPQVRAHRDSPGSATACPGDHTMAVWDKIVRACSTADVPAPEPPPERDEGMDLASAINHDQRPVIVQVGGDDRLYMKIRDATGGKWRDWSDLSAGETGFATCTAFVNPNSKTIEVFVTMKDGRTLHRWQTGADFAGWSAWADETR